MGGTAGVVTRKGHVTGAAAHVEAIEAGEGVGRAVHRHGTGVGEVEDAQLPALEEVFRAQGVVVLQAQGRRGRHRAAEDEPIVVGVDERHLAVNHQVSGQELVAEFRSGLGLEVGGVNAVADFHAVFFVCQIYTEYRPK